MDHENCGLPLLMVVVVDVVVFVIELELTTGLFKSLEAICHLAAVVVEVVDDDEDVVDVDDDDEADAVVLAICAAADEAVVDDFVGELFEAPPGGAGAIRMGLLLVCDEPVVVEITFDEVRPAKRS